MNPEVTSYIESLGQPWQAELCGQLRGVVQAAVPDVQERIQYGKPHFLRGKSYIAVIGVAKGWVSFTIFNAAGLQYNLFEPSDVSDRRTIKFKPGQPVDADALGRLMADAAKAL